MGRVKNTDRPDSLDNNRLNQPATTNTNQLCSVLFASFDWKYYQLLTPHTTIHPPFVAIATVLIVIIVICSLSPACRAIHSASPLNYVQLMCQRVPLDPTINQQPFTTWPVKSEPPLVAANTTTALYLNYNHNLCPCSNAIAQSFLSVHAVLTTPVLPGSQLSMFLCFPLLPSTTLTKSYLHTALTYIDVKCWIHQSCPPSFSSSAITQSLFSVPAALTTTVLPDSQLSMFPCFPPLLCAILTKSCPHAALTYIDVKCWIHQSRPPPFSSKPVRNT